MSDVVKTKLKIGPHEFEAEGPADVVREQFAAFKELVTAIPANTFTPRSTPAEMSTEGGKLEAATLVAHGTTQELPLDKVMKVEGRVVSLTVRRDSLEDEVMLVLFGQKILRNNDSVTGSEVLDGLRLTGRTIKRADYQLEKLTTAGDVITIGQGRASRYRLTNQGVAKARDLARTAIATVA